MYCLNHTRQYHIPYAHTYMVDSHLSYSKYLSKMYTTQQHPDNVKALPYVGGFSTLKVFFLRITHFAEGEESEKQILRCVGWRALCFTCLQWIWFEFIHQRFIPILLFCQRREFFTLIEQIYSPFPFISFITSFTYRFCTVSVYLHTEIQTTPNWNYPLTICVFHSSWSSIYLELPNWA